jgi:phage terminase large subunit GpA-like protein
MSASATAANRLRVTIADALRPPPDRTISEWADQFRILDSRSSAEPGPWRTERTPYLREPMDQLGPQSATTAVVMRRASQLGKTEALLNAMGFYIDAAPAPIMLVQPSKEAMDRFSRQRVTPLVDGSPALRGKVAEKKSRSSGNTLQAKEFDGGVLLMVGANVAADLASSPIRVLLMDEIDRFPLELPGEGDPVGIAERRTATFHNRKIGKVSTPTVENESRIDREFAATSQRHYEVPCPHCGTFQRLVWEGVRWPPGQPLLARYECQHCHQPIEHTSKADMIRRGSWADEDPDVAEAYRQSFDPPVEPAGDDVQGYALSTLYSPWFTWGDMAAEFVKAARDPVRLRVFVNTLLGESWNQSDGETVDRAELMDRAEDFGPGAEPAELPAGVVSITAGVDFQADRAVVEIVGWGVGEESWSLEYLDIYGDPSIPPDAGGELWEELDRVLFERRYTHHRGGALGIDAACLDTGHYTQTIYAYVKPRQRRNVWGIKGKAAEDGRPLWPREPSRNNRGRIDLYTVNVNAGKEIVYARLRRTDPGPGYCHFPEGRGEGYFAELTAETVTTKRRKGRKIRIWDSKGRRNEALDCRVYAYAALKGWLASGRRSLRGQLDRLPKRVEAGGRKTAPNAETKRKVSKRPRYMRRRKHWI